MPKNRICKMKDGRYSYQIIGASGRRLCLKSRQGETKSKFSKRCDALDRKATEDSGGMTLNALHDTWMRDHVKVHCSNAYISSCEQIYNTHIRSHLGWKEIEEVTRKDVADLLADLEQKGLKRSTISKVRSAFSSPYNWAIDTLGFSLRVPTDGLIYRTKKQADDTDVKRRCLTSEELERIFRAAQGSKYEQYFHILSLTGLRPSEGLGLQVRDVDFKNGLLKIRRGITMLDTSPLKTKSGLRDIPLYPQLEESLRRQVEKMAFATRESWLFPSSTGTPSMNALKCAFNRVLRQTAAWETGGHNGMKKLKVITPPVQCTLYDFRHTFATRMAEKGMNAKMLQSIMGHRDIQTTLTYYIEVTPEMTAEAVQIMTGTF